MMPGIAGKISAPAYGGGKPFAEWRDNFNVHGYYKNREYYNFELKENF